MSNHGPVSSRHCQPLSVERVVAGLASHACKARRHSLPDPALAPYAINDVTLKPTQLELFLRSFVCYDICSLGIGLCLTNRPLMAAYQYKQLPSNYFRLMTILPGGFSEPLCLQLTAFRIGNAPEYSALSYCWGDGPQDQVCCIQEVNSSSQLLITDNLHKALQRCKHATEEGYIWADQMDWFRRWSVVWRDFGGRITHHGGR
jgi:hypothetical protein